jgi:Leucine-rich repeat (LRR) protein
MKSGIHEESFRKALALDSLPATIKYLTGLVYLFLNYDTHLHAFPDSIGNLISLQNLNAEACCIDTIPASVNLNGCINLKYLYLGCNYHLKGTFPNISNLDSLKTLSLYYDSLKALSPFGQGQTKLKLLQLQGNKLDSLPSTLKHLTGLSAFGINNDSYLHNLPDSIGNLTSLETLWVYGCHLDSIPASVNLNGCTKLKSLWLQGNPIQGIFPNISNLDSLKYLDLHGCSIESLSPFGSGQTKLEQIYLNDNTYTLDSLPATIKYLTGLKRLWINRNVNFHALPDSIGNCTSLKNLYADNCHIESLPSSFGNLTNLDTLYLQSNQLTSLPSSITSITPTSGQLNVGSNKICCPNSDVKSWLDTYDSDWKSTQSGCSPCPDSSLVGFWRFNENSGSTCYDSSVYRNPGTKYGPTWTTGHSGSALNFSNDSDQVIIPNNSVYYFDNSFTVMAWVYMDSLTPKAQGVVSKLCFEGYEGSGWWTLQANDSGGWNGPYECGVSTGTHGRPHFSFNYMYKYCTVDAPNPVSTGWHHLVAVRNAASDTARLYIDGECVASSLDSAADDGLNNSMDIYVGACANYYSDAWCGTALQGKIDEVRLYNRALAASEIDSLYGLSKRRIAPQPKPVVRATKGIPATFGLTSLYPNPARSLVSIGYSVAGMKNAEGKLVSSQAPISINIYSVTGKLVKTIVNDVKQSGYHVETWDCMNSANSPVPTGIYFVRFSSGRVLQNWKLIVSK